MKPPAISGLRRKSRVVLSKHDPILANGAARGASNGSVATDAHASIAVLAYKFYEQRGRQDGHDVEDWLKAEQRVLDGMP